MHLKENAVFPIKMMESPLGYSFANEQTNINPWGAMITISTHGV